MPAGKYDLIIEQGTTFTKTFVVQVPSSSANPILIPFDFSGYTGAAQLRSQYDVAPALGDFAVTFPPSGSVTGSVAASGSITISLTASQTASFPNGIRGVWDLLLYQGSTITRLLEGEVYFRPRVTR